MKKIIAIASLLFSGANFISVEAKAQISVQINIGNQPAWGPTGYDYAQFYYFPDYDFYYDITRGQYIIFRNNVWSYINTVPSRYSFDPYNAYKVVVNQNKPYLYNKTHRSNYAQFKGYGSQQAMIRDSKETKYYASKGHPNYNGGSNTSGNNKTPNNNRTTTNNKQNNNRNTNNNSNVNRSQQNGQIEGGARNNQQSQNNNQKNSRNNNGKR